MGDLLVLYSDGLVEAHNPEGEMFGNLRLERLLSLNHAKDNTIQVLIYDLNQFTGEFWEQEDDVTFVTIAHPSVEEDSLMDNSVVLGTFSVSSVPGNERLAMNDAAAIIRKNGLLINRLEQVKTAVAEATMNAMEHGNEYDPEKMVEIEIVKSQATLSIFISDQSGGKSIPSRTEPDLEAKLVGEQSPRGWGLFLIKNMVDNVEVLSDEKHHTLHLMFDIKEDTGDEASI